jgi:hypothetical protein
LRTIHIKAKVIHIASELSTNTVSLKITSPIQSLLIESLTMSLMTENAGNMGVLAHDPTAIRALKVCEFILCCMKDTSHHPVENAHSASTDVAVKTNELDIYM